MTRPSINPADVIAEARQWIKTPYRHQASLRNVGCDCLGLVRGVWRALLGAEPEMLKPYTAEWAEVGGDDAMLDAARRHFIVQTRNELIGGDVVIFRPKLQGPAKHIAILSAPDRMIHAQDGHAVAEVALGAWWRRRVAGVFSFPLTAIR